MIDEILNNSNNYKIALDAIRCANERMHIEDYNKISKLQPVTALDNYEQRYHIMNQLIRARIISIDDNRLYLGRINLDNWLKAKLADGNEKTWSLVEVAHPDILSSYKFDSEILKEIGLRGEMYIISLLETLLSPNTFQFVEHLSISDDSLGFDIKAPPTYLNNKNKPNLLEVKTTSRFDINTKKFRFFLSRIDNGKYKVHIF